MPRGVCKSPELEAKRARKISEARKRKMAALGYLNSPETRLKIGAAFKGKRLSPEHCARMSAAKKGRKPANFEMAQALAHAAPKNDENHPGWKGDDVGYHALHAWITRKLGRPCRCERCGTTTAKRYEWANKSRSYLRDFSDWERLCVSCHRKDGYARGEYTARK